MQGPFLSRRAAAQHLGVGLATLDRLTRAGDGPPFVKLSPRRVGFPIEGIHAWARARAGRSVDGTAAQDNAPAPALGGEAHG